MSDFDVIVLGGGIGGLCAAALLARSKKRVLLLERLPFLGGRCSSLNHRGSVLTTGAVSIESDGALSRVFRELDLPFEIVSPDPQVAYRIDCKDRILPSRGGMAFLLHEAARRPAEADRIRNALQDLDESDLEGVSVSSWLAANSHDPGIFRIFRVLCGAILSVHPEEAPMVELYRLVKSRSFRRYGFPPRGNAKLAEELGLAVEREGGEILKRATVRKILVADGEARGVRWEREGRMEEAKAATVVSDLGVQQTADLAGRDRYDSQELDRIRRMRASYTLTIEVFSDRPLVEFPGIVMLPQARRAAFLTSPTLSCPELAPKGRHITTVLGPPVRSEEPFHGEEEFRALLQDARENLPGFDRPSTTWMMRSFRKDWPGFRARPGDEMPPETSIRNLYNVGDSVKPPGVYGVGACAESARRVVERIE